MTSGRYGLVLREVGRLLRGGTVASLGSSQLLERFAADRDEAAFEALVGLHGPMVLGTCRRMLADPHDVEDAFQATFLVLARKAGSIQDADRLGPWLHGVARRVATRSRALESRRKSVERPGGDELAVEAPDTLEGFELRVALDEELSRLPEKYRAPLVLCYLEGLTHDEAAQHLRWPVGTVRSRLAGGRDRLRDRLTRRGLAPSSATVPAILAQATIPQALLSTTVRVATSAGSVPAHVANLAKGALVAMMWNKLKLVAAVGLMAGLTVGGAGVSAQYGGIGRAESPVVGETPDQKSPEELQAENRSNQGRLAEVRRKEEDIRHRLNLMEITRNQLRLELLPPLTGSQIEEGINRINADIEKLEGELAAKILKVDALTREIKERREKVGADPGPLPQAKVPDSEKQKANPRRGQGSPSVMQLDGAFVLVIPVECDRATVLNTETGTRVTHRFSGRVTEVIPIISPDLVSLRFRGPEVRQVIAFDHQGEKWYPQDLVEPTTEANPIQGGGAVIYQIGRFIYVFSFQAKRWGVLEMKRDPGLQTHGIQNGKIIIPEGDIVHVYNATTGEWTHNDMKGPDVETPAPPDAAGNGPEPGAKPAANGPAAANPPSPQPIVHTLRGDPIVFAVISAERDRVTMIDSTTQERSSFRLPKGATEITPVSGSLESLMIKGPEITRTALYDRQGKRWYTHDLKEPATEVIAWSGGRKVAGAPELYALQIKGPTVSQLAVYDHGEKKWVTQDLREPAKNGVAPAVSPTTVTYRVGRFLYKYSSIAKKWSVLELKRKGPDPSNFVQRPDNDKTVIPDDDVIHIYDARTGEWTHIDTKDDK